MWKEGSTEMKSMRLRLLLALGMAALLLLGGTVAAAKPECTTIQDGVLTYSAGHYLEGEPLQMMKQGGAQVVNHRRPHPGHDVDAEVNEHPLQYHRTQIGQNDSTQGIVVMRGQAVVNGKFDVNEWMKSK